MNTELRNLFSEILRAGARAKLVAVVCALALVAILAGAGWISSRPHFVTLYSGIEDIERAGIEKALAEGGIKFRVSQPPGPFVVYVDEASFYEAQNLVALAEAFKQAPVGIATGESGAASIFLSSGERQQGMLKREWQEMEHQLETLDFVARATVTTSTPDTSPLRRKEPPTVSVTLQLRGSVELTDEQASSVAKLIRYRFNVPADNVVISDQSGRSLYDPATDGGAGLAARKLLEHSSDFDRELAERTNATLERAFGKNKALVTVTSEWDLDQRTIVAEKLEPKGVVVSEEKVSSKTPQGASPNVGGPAGTASNIASEGFGTDNAAVPGATSSSVASSDAASTSEEKKVYDTSKSTTQTVHSTPELKKLFVSLLVDASLDAKKDQIAEFVKNAVGFSGERDSFSVGTTTFAGEEVALDADGKPLPASEVAAPSAGPNRTLEMLLRRGVEIVAALGFLFLLFKTLKGARVDLPQLSLAGGGATASGEGAGEPDPELLARMQIEELVRTDPRRVGEILSRWAGEENKARAR